MAREHFVEEFSEILANDSALKRKEVPSLIEDFNRRSDLRFEEFLIHENVISRAQLLDALSKYYSMPSMDVRGIFFDHHLVSMFPQDVLVRHAFIPYFKDGDVLVVVTASPDDELDEIINKFVSYSPDYLVGYFRDILDSVEEYSDVALTDEPHMYDQDVREEREEEKHVEESEEFG